MDNQAGDHREENSVDAMLTAMAVWVTKFRHASGLRDEAMKCKPEDVARIARDLRVRRGELASLASKGPSRPPCWKRCCARLASSRAVSPTALP